MERLSIASFLAQGHRYHLYSYEPLSGLPAGTELLPATNILPVTAIYRDSRGSLAGFSNAFRYKLLLERGGWWADLDMVCIRPLDFSDEFVFATEPDQTVGTAIMRVPARSLVMEEACRASQPFQYEGVGWGATGPGLLGPLIEKLGVTGVISDPAVFFPFDWPEWRLAIEPDREWVFDPSTRALHLWAAMWTEASLDRNATYPRTCLYETLKQRYL
jgi:mannosyltransferase OCH1-like enzyme